MPEKTFTLSAQDGSFFQTGDNVGVYFERILEHPVEDVWAAITEAGHLSHWLGPAVVQPGKGGSIQLQMFGGPNGGVITQWRENALLEYAWDARSTVRWELLREGAGRTRLVFTHLRLRNNQLVDAARGWHYHLDVLAIELDEKPMPQNAAEHWDEISHDARERYMAAVKLLVPDPEPFVIERVFDAPVERVWQALTNKEEIKHWSFDIPGFEPIQGYEFTFNGQQDDRVFVHYCHITEVVAHRKLTYSWRYRDVKGITMVTWELFPEGKKTRLRLTHSGLEKIAYAGPDYQRQNFEMGWTAIFGELANWLQHAPVALAC